MRSLHLTIATALCALAPSAFADEVPGALASPNEKLDYLLSRWRGKTLDELHDVWGREKELTLRRPNRVYVFERRVKVRGGAFGVTVFSGGGLSCRARFEVNDADEIVRTSREGGGQECWGALRRYEAPD